MREQFLTLEFFNYSLLPVQKSKITLEQKDIRYSFTFDDIKIVERFKSYPLAEDRVQWFPWDSYNYSIIHLKKGQKLLITSLLVPNLDLPLESTKIKLKKRFYPFASVKANLK